MSETSITIVIPNWNGRKFLVECLASLKRQSSQDFRVTVVDNGSTDGSVDFLRTEYPEVEIISFPENRGFSAAVNAGIRKSTADWVFLLNNDIEVHESCVEQIHKAIKTYPDYDSFSVKMMSYHQREMIDGAGDAALRGGVGYRVGTLEEDQGQYSCDRDVFGACGGAAVYSRDFFRKVGLFDEEFFAYLEDLDINMRAVRAGMQCRFIASAVVYHIGSATSGSKINPLTVRLSTKNNINVIVKNYPVSLLFRFFPVICVYQFMWFLFVCKKGQITPYLQGLWQAFQQLPVMRKKRNDLHVQNSLSSSDFALVLTESEGEAVMSIMNRRAALGKGNFLLETYKKIFL